MTNHGRAPQWEIRRDGSAPTQPYVLAQMAGERGGDRSPLAIWDGGALRDGDVSVRMKLVGGHDLQAGGVVWRYRDENNYYLARTSAIEKNVEVFKVVNGTRHLLMTSARHDFALNAWSILKVTVRGNRFQVYLDHRRILQGQDETFTGTGRVGLCTLSDSVTYFDDFRVTTK
jgi:hypothetical protein